MNTPSSLAPFKPLDSQALDFQTFAQKIPEIFELIEYDRVWHCHPLLNSDT